MVTRVFTILMALFLFAGAVAPAHAAGSGGDEAASVAATKAAGEGAGKEKKIAADGSQATSAGTDAGTGDQGR